MSEYLYFWMMKFVAEALLYIGLFVAIMLGYIAFQLPTYFKQRRCKHEQVHEDSRCTVWCRSCGKNLGFIGTWRKSKGGL